MKRSRITAAIVVVASWCILAAWQYREFLHQRELIRERLVGQADAIVGVLVSGVKSHRWMGPFVESRLPATLEELVKSDQVLAVSIVPAERMREGDSAAVRGYVAGQVDLLTTRKTEWREDSYSVVRSFEFGGAAAGIGPMHGSADHEGRLHRGGGPPWRDGGRAMAASRFEAILVMDRTLTDAQIRREAWVRSALVACGGLLIVFVGLLWGATVRLAAARGKARLLAVESRHLIELGEAGAGLAHETRNPLGLIRGWAQRLAEAGLPTAQQQQQADAIVEECDRVTSRINEFLAFARPVRPRFEPVSVRDLLERLLIVLESDTAFRHVSVDLEGVPADAVVSADAEHLRQAAFNLIQNGISFAGDGGRVSVSLGRQGDGAWRLEVRDTGPGPPSESIESLFRPYFTTRTDGTGLGLAIVKNIATAHGWTVGYTRETDSHGVFWIGQIR